MINSEKYFQIEIKIFPMTSTAPNNEKVDFIDNFAVMVLGD